MNTYTTSRGITIEFLPIPRETMIRFRAAHPEPQPPTYEVTALSGVKETHAHDQTTITTPEEKAAYAEYERHQADYLRAFIRFFVLRGLKIHATMDEWREEQEYIGMPLPENKAALRFEWVTNAVLTTPEDYQRVMLGVIGASGAPEELLSQIEASFRGQVPGNTPAGLGNPAGAVDHEPGV